MLHKTLTFLLLAFISLSSCAISQTKQETGLLWKISDNKLEEPSYLFGTHHLVPISYLDSIDGLDEAFMATKQTIGELDMNNMGEMQMQLMIASLMPEGYSYDELMSQDDQKILDETLKEYVGTGLAQFEQMKPAMLNTLLSVMMYKKLYPSDENGLSMDEHFQKEARDR